MSARLIYDRIVKKLRQSKNNYRCSELVSDLETLGFEVRNGRRGGHKIYTHDGIPDFTSGSFNCGHGINSKIKPVYINQVRKIVERYEEEIIEYLEDENDD